MKKYCLLFIVFAFFFSCDDATTTNLSGKWQLKTVEKNGLEAVVDTVWYNFQSESIFSIQIYEAQQDEYLAIIGMKTLKDNVLSIELGSTVYIEYTDWDSIYRSFTIDKVNRKELILISEEGYTYSFIKF